MSVLIPCGRKSSKEDPRESRERQSRSFANYAKNHPDDTLLPMVWEGAVSAGTVDWKERGVGLALKRVESGEADGLLFESVDRATRADLLATSEMWREFERLGIVLVCLDGIDTRTGDMELNFGVRALLANEQWKQFSKRQIASKQNAVERGCHISGHVAFGYIRTRVDGRGAPLVVHEEFGPLVTRAFEMRARGASIEEIARFLDENTPDSERWSTTKVSSMLKRRTYLGEARVRSTNKRTGKVDEFVNPDAHSALVDEDTFRVVQGTFRSRDPRTNVRDVNILAGSIRCEGCGYGADRSIVNGKYEVYRCRNRNCREKVSISAPKVDALVWNRLLVELRAEVAAGFEVESFESRERVADLHARVAPLNATLELLRDPEYIALIGPAAAKVAARETREKLLPLERELAETNAVVAGDGPTAAELLDLAERGELTPEQTRVAISRTFDSVIVGRAPRGTAIEDRVAIFLAGDPNAPARPARGRPARNYSEDESGELAA